MGKECDRFSPKQAERIITCTWRHGEVASFLHEGTPVSEPKREWYKDDDGIRFSFISDDTTGEEWIERLEGGGSLVGYYTKRVLRSPDFKPTDGVTYEIVVYKGLIFKNDDRTTENIRANAKYDNLLIPNAEVACLIREKFTDEDIESMGLESIVIMHEPIKDTDCVPCLLYAKSVGNCRCLDVIRDEPDKILPPSFGFAFVMTEDSFQS